MTQHWAIYSCPAGCEGTYQSVSSWKDHWESRHSDQHDIPAAHLDALVRPYQQCANGDQTFDCALCAQVIHSPDEYLQHANLHLRRIFLLALPEVSARGTGVAGGADELLNPNISGEMSYDIHSASSSPSEWLRWTSNRGRMPNRFPLEAPPVCPICKCVSLPAVVKASNSKGNAGRSYYYCDSGHARHFLTWNDNRGVMNENPLCWCGYPSRRTGMNYACSSKHCGFHGSAALDNLEELQSTVSSGTNPVGNERRTRPVRQLESADNPNFELEVTDRAPGAAIEVDQSHGVGLCELTNAAVTESGFGDAITDQHLKHPSRLRRDERLLSPRPHSSSPPRRAVAGRSRVKKARSSECQPGAHQHSQQPDLYEGHMNCFGEEVPPRLQDVCPEEERCIFESRWRHRYQSGQDMWTSIQRDFAQRFGRRYDTEMLQKKFDSARSQYIEWLSTDVRLHPQVPIVR